MFGSHLSIAGSLPNALLKEEKLGFKAVQILTKN
jgi:endonuclease IV